MSEDLPLVLVVEDEPDLADLYAAWLQGEYRVRTAYGGQEALEQLDEEVDVILLDRRMPGLSGDEVLEAVRGRDIDCRVAMVTAVEPDFDIVAMGFDDYLVKPVARDALIDTVDRLELRGEYDEGMQELFALASKKALLESEKTESELVGSAEYEELDERLEAIQTDLDGAMGAIGEEDDFDSLFRDFENPSTAGSISEADPFGGVNDEN